MSEPAAPITSDEGGGVRELRLAVVLYGGVSLAIYMHGTTKELHRLVKASALEDAGGGHDGDAPSERVYQRLIRRLAERDAAGVRTRVVVDVIAGTSAGGINGVYLAKALAHNLSQDGLRDVWLDRGDIGGLLRGPAWVPWAVRAPALLARATFAPPLDGDGMARWLYEALAAMDGAAPSPTGLTTLMPDRHELELFVTATDFHGYDRDVMVGDPGRVRDHAHRHVLRFRHSDGDGDFGPGDNGWLAFSARATSSFPGAFPPVSPHSFAKAIGRPDGLPAAERFFRIYELSRAAAETAPFVDGGVLDNRPFDHVVRAIRRRPAESEVDRRLLYLEPDPDGPAKNGGGTPNPIGTVLGAISGIPRKQPILDEILEITRHNERVRRIRDIIELSFGTIAERVEQVVGTDLDQLPALPPAADLARWRDDLDAEARTATGIAYPTYLRSRVSAVVERYARTVCELSRYPDDCNQASFGRGVLRAWAHDRLFTEREGRLATAGRHEAFLRRFDLDYGVRRIRFVIDALSWWYRADTGGDAPPREELDRGKAVLYAMRDRLVDAMTGKDLGPELARHVEGCFEQRRIDEWETGPDEYATAHAGELMELERAFGDALEAQLEGFDALLFAAVQDVATGWSARIRGDLLVRYLGFPLWDAILFPVQSVADAGERDAVEVVRFSPLDAEQLGAPPRKLSGMGKAHFGAFFDRAGRERDYLWGRLDGAERLIGILLGKDASPEERAAWCAEAFAAIAAEEQDVLPGAGPLVEQVRSFASERRGT